MAIIFDTGLDTTGLLYTGENNIIEFYSSSVVSPVQKAEIIFFNGGNTITKTIYPGPLGKFYYNFSEIIKTLINKTNYVDDSNYSSIIVDWTNKVYLSEDITIKIVFQDTSFEETTLETKWLDAYFQYYYKKSRSYVGLESPMLLNAIPYSASNGLKFWQGYPFAFSFYTGGAGNMTIIRNGVVERDEVDITQITKLIISNGANNLLNLVNGFNYLTFFYSTGEELNVVVEKITPGCFKKQVYIKWLNSYGDYNFWLFNSADVERSNKSLGYKNNDFNNFTNTISSFEHLGFTGSDTLTLFETFSENDLLIIRDLFISPKVFIFTGTPGVINTFIDWLEVKLKPGSFEIKNKKYNTAQLKISLELPELSTRKI